MNDANHVYTLDAGRCILRDGVPFVTIHRVERGPVYVEPADADAFAYVAAQAMTMLDVLRDVRGMLPVAARLHPDDLAALQTRVCNVVDAAETWKGI